MPRNDQYFLLCINLTRSLGETVMYCENQPCRFSNRFIRILPHNLFVFHLGKNASIFVTQSLRKYRHDQPCFITIIVLGKTE